MRPASIVLFERLFLASLVVSVASFVLTYEQTMGLLESDPAMAGLGFGSSVILGLAIAGYAIYLLLWFLIARKASSVAKWILVVLVALSLISLLATLAAPWDLILLISAVVYALEVAAVVCLFNDDAKDWFSGKWSADPTTFD